MLKSDFYYHLPTRLIAQKPLLERSASRLLFLDGSSGSLSDLIFNDLIDLLNPGDLLVFNDTKVIPARLFGRKQTGGKVEVLIERILEGQRALAHVRSSKSPKSGNVLIFGKNGCKVVGREGELYVLEFNSDTEIEALLNKIGHVPLPAYIKRPDENSDRDRYQTVYAKKSGAVAAPTAGLHFDQSFLEKLRAKQIELAFITLHVGSGTFLPVRVENLLDHKMHSEYFEVDERTVNQVQSTYKRGGRVVAVGTTAARALESASLTGELRPFKGETTIFITPGFQFRCINKFCAQN